MKIALVCSHGGHLTETLQILPAFEGHDIFFCTYTSARDEFLCGIAPVHLTDNIGYSLSRMIKSFFWAWRIIKKEKPDIVFSLGAEIAVPFLFLGKLKGIKTVFIESWCRVETRSLTGKLVYPLVDQYWVQWPEHLDHCGPKAKFRGAVI